MKFVSSTLKWTFDSKLGPDKWDINIFLEKFSKSTNDGEMKRLKAIFDKHVNVEDLNIIYLHAIRQEYCF